MNSDATSARLLGGGGAHATRPPSSLAPDSSETAASTQIGGAAPDRATGSAVHALGATGAVDHPLGTPVADTTHSDGAAASWQTDDDGDAAERGVSARSDLVGVPVVPDWQWVLHWGGQGLEVASKATSLGFATARQATSLSLTLAKHITQGAVALSALALDASLNANDTGGAADNGSHGTAKLSAARIAHDAVGGLFDAVTYLALGGIDVGRYLTDASLGAATTGVQGLRRALGSEVLRSLAAFSRLVRREWNADDASLPPGGIPAYSTVRITKALMAWVLIQSVTRRQFEAKMLRQLDEIDVAALQARSGAAAAIAAPAVGREGRGGGRGASQLASGSASEPTAPAAAADAGTASGRKEARITSETTLPDGEGDLIMAEIGSADDAVGERRAQRGYDGDARGDDGDAAKRLADVDGGGTTLGEELQTLRRYSKLVMGVYGGVALAFFGTLPADYGGRAAAAPGPTNASARADDAGGGGSGEVPPPLLGWEGGVPHTTRQDEEDFLRAAQSLDVDEESEADVTPSGTVGPHEARSRRQATGSGGRTRGEVLFSAEDDATSSTASSSLGVGGVGDGDEGLDADYVAVPSLSEILLGQHDDDLFHRVGGLEKGQARAGDYAEADFVREARREERASRRKNARRRADVGTRDGAAASLGARARGPEGSGTARADEKGGGAEPTSKPRYYVVTHHETRRIVLVLRGSLSLGDLATDLTCESVAFPFDEGNAPPPPPPPPPTSTSGQARTATTIGGEPLGGDDEEGGEEDVVHEGMLETAQEIGDVGRPVHRAVANALLDHEGYDLDIAGHSLGGGVATLLALMWACPETQLTTAHSGLPPGRRVHAWALGVPCVMSERLAERCRGLVTSFMLAYDVVAHLSLGSVLDVRNAVAWLCYEDARAEREESATAVTATSARRRGGSGQDDDDEAAEAASDAASVFDAASSSASVHAIRPPPMRLNTLLQENQRHLSALQRLRERTAAADGAGGSEDGEERATAAASEARKREAWAVQMLSLRRALEANMHHVELLPPGDCLYAFTDPDDLLPADVAGVAQVAAPRPASDLAAAQRPATPPRLFRLKRSARRADVFGQMVFSRRMLSVHLPSHCADALQRILPS